MARPILFSSVSREKFDKISEEDKKKKNYQIKEEDGTVSKYISNLEGGGSGRGMKVFELTFLTQDGNDYYYRTVDSAEEIERYVEENGLNFKFYNKIEKYVPTVSKTLIDEMNLIPDIRSYTIISGSDPESFVFGNLYAGNYSYFNGSGISEDEFVFRPEENYYKVQLESFINKL